MPFKAEVRVELKPGVNDPEGANARKALELLGFEGVNNVRAFHSFAIELDAGSEKDARERVEEMCKRLLVNPVIHTYRVNVESA